MRWPAAAALGVVLLASGCGDSSPSRDDALRALRDETVVPGLEQASASAAALESAIAESCSATPAALAGARQAWEQTRAYWAGPVMDRRSWSWVRDPVDPARVAALAGAKEPATIEADYVRTSIGSGQRGYEALEVLLADKTLGPPERRCAYLRAVGTVAAAELAAAVAAWKADPEALPKNFTVDELVGDAVGLLEMLEKELGKAIKEKDFDDDLFGGDEIEVDHGMDDVHDRLAGLRAVLVGPGGSDEGPTGLAPLLDDEIVTALEDRLGAAEKASAGLDGSLAAAVDEDPDAVAETLKRVTELKRTIATQVVSHLGVTVGFGDTDGDSG